MLTTPLDTFLPIEYAPYNAWSAYWLGSVSFFIFVLFLPPELYALATGHPENTLSAQVWRIGQVMLGQPITAWSWQHWVLITFVTLLFGWLIVHFSFGVLR